MYASPTTPLLVGKESAEERQEGEEDGGTLTAGKGGNGRGGGRTKLPNEGRDSPLLILTQRKKALITFEILILLLYLTVCSEVSLKSPSCKVS